MAETKLVVIYPYPTDVAAFEKAYVEDHVPLAKEKIKGVTKFVATKVLGTPDGKTPPFYRVAELHFPSIDALKQSAGSPGGQEAVAHAISISSGGTPIFLIAEQETITF
ncbi:MAG TPA: EthD family reductase [Blastocatellia bacterium]|nr:EthD family reductase [Blastocatellia bacterium]